MDTYDIRSAILRGIESAPSSEEEDINPWPCLLPLSCEIHAIDLGF